MLEIPWGSHITTDPLLLADAVELALAFDRESSRNSFTKSDFQHMLSTESLNNTEQSYVDGDQADELTVHFDQALELIHRRSLWLTESYPFCAERGEIRYQRPDDIKPCLPYLLMLVCSNATFLPHLKSGLPVQFEDLCKEAMRVLFPRWAEVLSFSQKSEDRKNIFGYAATDAVPTLASKLHTTLVSEDRLPATQEEFGIDIVAICPFEDNSPYAFFAFAQCTIQKDWWVKRHEAIASNGLADFIHLNVQHSNFLMIPYFPRHSLDEWSERPNRTGNCILCDRLRICILLRRSDAFKQGALPSSISDVFGILENGLNPMQD